MINANGDHSQITFLDVTESYNTLMELLTTLFIVGLMMLFVIFAISLFFANRSIAPIAETWEKQKQFFADVSHELKTPLAIINANSDALLANEERRFGASANGWITSRTKLIEWAGW